MIGRKKAQSDQSTGTVRDAFAPKLVGVPEITPARYAVKASDGRWLIQARRSLGPYLYADERVLVWVSDLETADLTAKAEADERAEQFPPGSVTVVQILRAESRQ